MISPAPVFPSPIALSPRARLRRGLTVIELLASTVISLIVMGATVQLFGTVGSQISNGRSNIEAGDRLRATLERLRRDLRGITVDMRTWNRPEDASGYFEIIKGPPGSWDKNISPANASSTFNSTTGAPLTGYTKDGLFLTTRSNGAPFVGRVLSSTGQVVMVESQVAEVAWFMQPTSLTPGTTTFTPTNPPTYTLYRRQLLVLPGIGGNIATGSPEYIPAGQYYDSATGQPNPAVPLYDLSAHLDGSTVSSNGQWQSANMVLNSLADLAYRENRFGHFYPPLCGQNNYWGTTPFGAGSPPFGIYPTSLAPPSGPCVPFPPTPATDPNLRYGEDVVLTNVLSFDVKVWDPYAQVLQDANGTPLVPSDPGYSGGKPIGLGVYGAYVDLNWNNGAAVSNPSGVPAPYFAMGYYGPVALANDGYQVQKSYLAPPANQSTSSNAMNAQTTFPMQGSAIYDTWPAGYEAWLYDGQGSTGAPQTSNASFNGFDDTGANGVDSPNERLTSPPYPVPLRGVQIKIRLYEPSSKQIREATIQESFVPD